MFRGISIWNFPAEYESNSYIYYMHGAENPLRMAFGIDFPGIEEEYKNENSFLFHWIFINGSFEYVFLHALHYRILLAQ